MNPILTLSPVAPPAVLGAAALAAVVPAGVAAGTFAGVFEQAAAIIPIAISSPILRFNIPLPLAGSSRWADASAAAVPGDGLATRGRAYRLNLHLRRSATRSAAGSRGSAPLPPPSGRAGARRPDPRCR